MQRFDKNLVAIFVEVELAETPVGKRARRDPGAKILFELSKKNFLRRS